MRNLVAIVGMAGSGKSLVSNYLESIDYKRVYFGKITYDMMKKLDIPYTVDNDNKMKLRIREQYGMAAYAILSLDKIGTLLLDYNVVIDGLYSWEEYKVLKKEFPYIKLIAVISNKNIRYKRLNSRKERCYTEKDAINRDITEIENVEKGGPICFADYYILNNESIDQLYNKIDLILKEI